MDLHDLDFFMDASFWSHTARTQQFLLNKLTATFNTLSTIHRLETKITRCRVKSLTKIGLVGKVLRHSTFSVQQELIQEMEMQEMCKKVLESVWCLICAQSYLWGVLAIKKEAWRYSECNFFHRHHHIPVKCKWLGWGGLRLVDPSISPASHSGWQDC